VASLNIVILVVNSVTEVLLNH